MPRHKSLQTLFVEAILFVSLFALVGHLSINFWERYVVQNELSKMKSSLYTLKDTINHIGIAYNQLYKELQFLADVAEGGPLKFNAKYEKYEPTEHHTELAQELLEDIQVQAMIDSGIKIKDVRKIKSETVQTVLNKDTQIPLNATKVNKLEKVDKKDKNVGDTAYRNKKIQHMHAKTLQSKEVKNTGTVTRNPTKSEAVNTDEIDETQESKHNPKRQKRNNIHKCHDNTFCTAADYTLDNSEDDFTKF